MSLPELQGLLISFNERRGWRAKHSPLHQVLSISSEAAELLKCFQWKADGNFVTRIRSDAGASISSRGRAPGCFDLPARHERCLHN
jgi:hypothetical protein